MGTQSRSFNNLSSMVGMLFAATAIAESLNLLNTMKESWATATMTEALPLEITVA